MNSIEIESLSFGYGRTEVLNDINLRFEGPGLYCIIGPNGVGKSTLVKCINGLLRPTSGSIRVNGRDTTDYSVRELSEEIAYVPASSSSAFPMSVIDSVLLGRESANRWRTDPEDVAISYRALRVMNLEGLSMRSCGELSAGQMQKVSLCRGLVRQSPIMILDEPTSNLDIRHQVFICDFLHELARESGELVVMISHDLNLAARFADEIVVMRHPGTVHSSGTPWEVISEEMISEVYSVGSEVIDHKGRPHVILESAEDW